jgi:hypothetical protein
LENATASESEIDIKKLLEKDKKLLESFKTFLRDGGPLQR